MLDTQIFLCIFIKNNFIDIGNDAVAQSLLKANRKRIFGHLIVAMQAERPEMRHSFDRSAQLFYAKQFLNFFLNYKS